MIPTTALIEWLNENGFAPAVDDPEGIRDAARRAVAAGKLTGDLIVKLCAPQTAQEQKKMTASPEKAFGGIRVKDPSEKFSTKRWSARHAKTGMPVMNGLTGSEVETSSEADHARLGAIVKKLASKSLGSRVLMDPHEDEFLKEMCDADRWVGDAGGDFYEGVKGSSLGVKALLDDSTSGGLEITPVAVDEQLVTFPLLHSELFPYIDLQPLNKGRRIEGASVANVSLSSGGADGAAMPLFTTTSMVNAIDRSVFVANLSIEVGLDFFNDSIQAMGRLLEQLLGEESMRWLDEQIVLGDGTTEPEGLLVASGITTVSSDNGASGPPTLQDYYDLMFSIGKQYRNPSLQPSFVSNDTVYSRSRGIRVDPHAIGTTVDQRPVFGIDAVNSYRTLDWPHRIQNDIGNTTLLYGCLKKYRMHRRAGLEIRVETGGKELSQKNLALIVARMRYAGKVQDVDAFAKITDMQS